MLRPPEKLQDALLKTSKATFGKVNQASKYLMEIFNPQNKNIFEMLIAPESATLALSETADIDAAVAATDSLIAKVFLQSIDVPLMQFEYERINNIQVVTDVVYPDECTMVFLENEEGVVRNWLNHWTKQMVFVSNDITGGMGLAAESPNAYTAGWTFRDNQNIPKKKAIIIPQMKLGLPSTAWIEIRGMRIKSIENVAFAQDDSEPMKISVTMAVDNIWIKSPL